LITLHRRLLDEHHDFFLSPQLLSTGGRLRKLASRFASPEHVWRHWIDPFLELLRHHLPASLGRLFTFVNPPHSLMELWSDTMPTFEDSWIECLGDLGRYRMAIEDDEIRDREVWTPVLRHRYLQTPNIAPAVGKDHHRLATMTLPHAMYQLLRHAGSIRVSTLFTSAKDSVMTLFDPVLNTRSSIPPFAEETGSISQNNERVSSPSLFASSIFGMFLLSDGASASPTGDKSPVIRDESQSLVAFNSQWPFHLCFWLFCIAYAGLAWAIETQKDANTQNYGNWFLIAASVCYLLYGYKAFVEKRLDSATR
jgi:hypothetical protein